MAIFDWQLLEDEEEIMDEILEGLNHLDRDTLGAFIAAIVYEAGIDFDELRDRIAIIDGEDDEISEDFESSGEIG